MPLKFIKSQRGGKLLLHQGFLLSLKSVNTSNVTWRCIEYKKSSCKVIVHTTTDKKSGDVIDVSCDHNHPADIASVECKKVKESIKKKAVKGNHCTGTAVSKALAKVSSPVLAQLPKVESLVRIAQRAKHTDPEQGVINPPGLKELVIPPVYQETFNNEKFLLHDSGNSAGRFLIFTTEKNMNLLAKCDQWCCDGTFDSVPVIFKQLYTIHGLYRNKLLPLVYILAPNKTQSLYSAVLSIIKQYNSGLKPQRVIVDFERAFIVAFKDAFPKCVISGCLFHFSQCVYRHVQTCGLQVNYNTDMAFYIGIKMIMALACVPVDDVIGAYEELLISPFFSEHDDELNTFLIYVERTWIGERKRTGTGRTEPLFQIKLWNCYESIINGESRTNNGVEGWHSSLNKKVGTVHACFSKYMEVIKDIQVITEASVAQIDTGVNVAANKRKVYVKKDERIKYVVENYNPQAKLRYLRDVAKVLKI